ncbi:hypothetical protein VOM14_11310 [Paraburkholderia sp. MPAMCS5]|uniref:hypothetical protein n=1 Tax=Paraburkholderia sp. MPAMCS5 TaxID=3112563 RepID=UPI002E17549E|nr:hypothetical protein [Paraburkholderia sp. MPAMCS5]
MTVSAPSPSAMKKACGVPQIEFSYLIRHTKYLFSGLTLFHLKIDSRRLMIEVDTTCPRPLREPRPRGKVPRERKSTAVAARPKESEEWRHCKGGENLFAAVLWSLIYSCGAQRAISGDIANDGAVGSATSA